MKKKIVSVCISIGLLTTILPLMTIAYQNPNPGDIIIVDDEGDGDYTSIQEAIYNACPGDIIQVYSGTYDDVLNPDSLIVNKPVILEGIPQEYGVGDDTGKPLVDGYNGVKVMVFETHHVTISGFILGALIIYHSTNVTITNNVLNSVRDHGGEEGILIIRGENIQVSHNALRNHGHALYIDVEPKSNIHITHNNFINNIRNAKFRISGYMTSNRGTTNKSTIVFKENYWGTDYTLWKEDHLHDWKWGFIQYTLFFLLFCHKSLYTYLPLLPKPIAGKIQLFDDKSSYDISLTGILFDRHPAQEPNTL